MPANPTPTRLAASHFGGVFAYALAAVFAVLAGVSAASAQPVATPPPESRPVTVTLVHLNDVYEILPVEGGKSGGLARVATVIRQLKSAQPALITTLGGDYLSPSATTCTTMGWAVGAGTRGISVPLGERLMSNKTPASMKPARTPIRIFRTVRMPEFYFNFITSRVSPRLESVKTNPASLDRRWK